MRKLTENLTRTEVTRAFNNWYVMYNNQREGREYANPHVFLGRGELLPSPTGYPSWVATPQAASKVRMLASPYHRILMKAFIARTGYQRKLLPCKP